VFYPDNSYIVRMTANKLIEKKSNIEGNLSSLISLSKQNGNASTAIIRTQNHV
jgi:hypothetical protein